ncbi:MAG: glycine cleavage system protein H [Candidatus Heimdallarchaeum aukensis]|uniref:Glycine cleavage system protein H n=1 Tax=Candidatus Heimdallarchaeum aukensis TaxID=2876573 RepID=A0A9Y1BMZ1_9ARCH|nr:MAG: glycine cleavage system protein H [Candidatus Heimdallarchaeum aukensis]
MKIKEYFFPEDLLYDISKPGHIWIRKIEENKIEIGIDDYAAKRAGEIEFIRTMKVGKQITKGGTIGTYETGKWIGQIKSPVSGKIVEKNELLKKQPELVNKAPYSAWIVRIEGAKIEEELKENELIVEAGEKLKEHILFRISKE